MAKYNLPKVNLEAMQLAAPTHPIYVRDLQGDLNSFCGLFTFCHIAADLRRSLAYLKVQIFFTANSCDLSHENAPYDIRSNS